MSDKTRNGLEMIRKEGLERFVEMVPEAIDQLGEMLNDPEVSASVKAQLIEMILNRGLGKPEESVNMTVKNNDLEEAYASVQEMIEEIRRNKGIK